MAREERRSDRQSPPAEAAGGEPLAAATQAARGGWVEPFTTRPSAPPVYLTTAFDFHDLDQIEAVYHGQERGYVYTRDGNPNQEAFATDVARLEGAAAGVACASGMGALTAILVALTKSGDHIVAAKALYGRSRQLLNHLQSSFGVQVTYFDVGNLADLQQAVTPQTKLCLVETISNPLVEVANLPEIRRVLGTVPLLVDSTFATPSLCRPLDHGATLVWHSASKYLNGHGDVMLGVVVGPEDLVRRIRGLSSLYGVNANPFECWLATRGMRTLPLRMARVSESALVLAKQLQQHRAVERVYYPGLPEHPTHALAQQLLPHGFGGMLAFDVRGGRKSVNAVFQRLAEVIPFSPTLADARTTFSYPSGTSHKFMSATERQQAGLGDGLIRLSVGLEDPHDVARELFSALDQL